MGTIEQLFGPGLRGQPTVVLSGEGQGDPWAGRTLIASGAVTATVSTNLVSSGKTLWMLGITDPGSIAVATNSGGGVKVNSIVDGVSFALSRPTGVAVPWDEYVTWAMFKVL